MNRRSVLKAMASLWPASWALSKYELEPVLLDRDRKPAPQRDIPRVISDKDPWSGKTSCLIALRYVEVDGVDYSDWCTGANLFLEQQQIECEPSDGWRTFRPGLKSWSLVVLNPRGPLRKMRGSHRVRLRLRKHHALPAVSNPEFSGEVVFSKSWRRAQGSGVLRRATL